MGCSHLASALLLLLYTLLQVSFFLFSSVLQFKTVERQVMSVHITTYLYRCLIGLLVALVADPHHHLPLQVPDWVAGRPGC